ANFPVSSDAAQKTFGGFNPVNSFPTGDAWVAQLDAGGSSVIYASYFGGKGDEFPLGIALDSSGVVYIAGNTLSSDLPVTTSAVQKTYGGTQFLYLPFGDGFMAKFGATVAP